MRAHGFEHLRQAAVFAVLLLLPSGVQGQLRPVVTNEIAVSETEASLLLGFQEGGQLEISLTDGRVLVDGESIGDYARRDGLDLAWRALLGEVITLDDGPLAQRLNDWDPPENLSGPSLTLASRLDAVLEEALAEDRGSAQAEDLQGVSVTGLDQEGLVGALLTRSDALSRLGDALEGAALDQFTLKVGEDVVVDLGEEISGDLVIVDGDLVLHGTVDGDVILIGGTARLGDQGVITGDLRVSGGTLVRAGGSVSGSLIQLDSRDEGSVVEEAELEEIRRELESEIRRELRHARQEESRRRSPFFEFMGHIGSAIAGLLENLITFIVLSILGVLAVHFQRERLEVVATTARRAPVRSAVVGLAGGFFLLPIWIVGMIALAITIIGIPVLLAWVPLFPIAAGLAILFGYLGVARNVGEWVAEQEYRGLEWIRGSNTFYTVIAGVGALVIPYVAVNVSRIIGFGVLTGLLGFAASMVTFAAGAVGLGAVLLTRGGKIRPLDSYYDFEEDYWADMEDREEAPVEESRAAEEPSAETEPQPGSGSEGAEAGDGSEGAGDGSEEAPDSGHGSGGTSAEPHPGDEIGEEGDEEDRHRGQEGEDHASR